jgi:hypothetical protein
VPKANLKASVAFIVYNTSLEIRQRGAKIKVKVKVKLSLCLTKHHAMKAYWGVEV